MPKLSCLAIFIFLIAIGSNCFQFTQIDSGSIRSHATLVELTDCSNRNDEVEFVLVDDDFDQTADRTLAKDGISVTELVLFSPSLSTPQSSLHAKQSVVLRL